MTNPESLIKRARKLKRREYFLRLREAIEAQSLSSSKRIECLAHIMAETASGTITPHEARRLTKAI